MLDMLLTHLLHTYCQDASYEEGLPYLRGMPEAFARCADVTLAVGERELPVHSQVLASKSAFFAGMWAGTVEHIVADMRCRAHVHGCCFHPSAA
jgi:BTB/POZ domain